MHTYTRLGAPSTMIRTFCRFGLNRRLVATIEWLRLCPNAGPLRQEWQTLAMAPEYRSDPRGTFSAMPRAGSTSAGPTLPERYRVLRHLASGGMASVWEAEDELLGRRVAVKVLAEHLAEDVSARERFQREARAAAAVSDHPNVVTIYDVSAGATASGLTSSWSS